MWQDGKSWDADAANMNFDHINIRVGRHELVLDSTRLEKRFQAGRQSTRRLLQ
jgi:hypothetical protein